MKEYIKILLIEDDESFGMLLQNYLGLHKYKVDWAKNGVEGWNRFIETSYHLIICDVMMPKMDGFDLAEKIIKRKPETVLIFLTAKALKEDQLKGFDLGAMDYLVKPFDSDILLKKITSLLRLKIDKKERSPEAYTLASLELNTQSRVLKSGDQSKTLTPKENLILSILLEDYTKQSVTNTDDLLIKVWGDSDFFTKRSLDVFISKLRSYLKSITSDQVKILNVHGRGYRVIET